MSLIPFILDLADELHEFSRCLTSGVDINDFGFGLYTGPEPQNQPSQQQQQQQHPQQQSPRRSRASSFSSLWMPSKRHHPYNRIKTACCAKTNASAEEAVANPSNPDVASASTGGTPGKSASYSVVNKNGFQVSMNVKQFAPSELSVKTIDNCIVVEGRHDDKEDGHGVISRHFVRKYMLPKGYDPNDVLSTLSSDGILTVKAPPPPPPATKNDERHERIIEIQSTPGPTPVVVVSSAKETTPQIKEQQQTKKVTSPPSRLECQLPEKRQKLDVPIEQDMKETPPSLAASVEEAVAAAAAAVAPPPPPPPAEENSVEAAASNDVEMEKVDEATTENDKKDETDEIELQKCDDVENLVENEKPIEIIEKVDKIEKPQKVSKKTEEHKTPEKPQKLSKKTEEHKTPEKAQKLSKKTEENKIEKPQKISKKTEEIVETKQEKETLEDKVEKTNGETKDTEDTNDKSPEFESMEEESCIVADVTDKDEVPAEILSEINESNEKSNTSKMDVDDEQPDNTEDVDTIKETTDTEANATAHSADSDASAVVMVENDVTEAANKKPTNSDTSTNNNTGAPKTTTDKESAVKQTTTTTTHSAEDDNGIVTGKLPVDIPNSNDDAADTTADASETVVTAVEAESALDGEDDIETAVLNTTTTTKTTTTTTKKSTTKSPASNINTNTTTTISTTETTNDIDEVALLKAAVTADPAEISAAAENAEPMEGIDEGEDDSSKVETTVECSLFNKSLLGNGNNNTATLVAAEEMAN